MQKNDTMKLFYPFLAALLIFAQSLLATNQPETEKNNTKQANEVSCTLSPPSQVSPKQISADWADIEWTSVSGAANYLVKTYDVASGQEVHSITMPGTATNTRVYWPDSGSGTYQTKVWSVCSSGEQSSSNNSTNPFFGLILELVATGYQRPSSISDICVVSTSPTSCSSFQWEGNGAGFFKIAPPDKTVPGEYKTFGHDGNHFTLDHVNNGYEYSKIDNKYYIVRLYEDGPIIATLQPSLVINANGNLGHLYRIDENNMNYQIFKVSETASGRPGTTTKVRSEYGAATENGISIAPNPFSDNLVVDIPAEAPSSRATAWIMDITGRVQMSQTTDAGQSELFFNTTSLAPGVYVLKTERNGVVEIEKIVKSN